LTPERDHLFGRSYASEQAAKTTFFARGAQPPKTKLMSEKIAGGDFFQ
jgi:hypothetical protein